MKKSLTIACLMAAASSIAMPALAFEPTRPVEFVVTAGPGGGTDIFARTIQAIISKYELIKAPVVVVNKGSAGGAEGFVYAATAKGDPYKLTFGTNNAYLLPIRAKVPYTAEDLMPVAALASDEFVLWVNAGSDAKTAADFIAKAKAAPGELKVAGSQSKDVDQVLTSMISHATDTKIGYVPFKSGGEAAVQLARGRPRRGERQQSERERRPVAGGHGEAALRLQARAAQERGEGLRRHGLERHSDLQGNRNRRR
jgi:putative tricarboxylic transport membrane protein